MPVFVVERQFAESFDPDDETLRLVDQYHLDNDIKWLTSFLSADKKKTYCLYEVDDAEVLRQAPLEKMPAATRKQMLIRLARAGARRLHDLEDPPGGSRL